jgi:Protein of unknown function (DUF3325)
MHSALILLAAMAANIAGLGWLAIAMDVHWRQVRGPAPSLWARATRLRVLGALALVASFVLCLAADHTSMAVLVWVMALAVAALIVAFTLAWRPRWLAVLAPRARE